MKTILFLTISLVILSFFVSAQAEVAQNVQNITSLELKNKTNEALAKEIALPSWAQTFSRNIFKTEETIVLSQFIVLIVIWLVLFLMLAQIMQLMPFFKGAVVWIVAFLVSLLMGIGGAINSLSKLFFGIFRPFDYIKDWSLGLLVLVLITLLGIYFIFSKLISKLKQKFELGEVEGKSYEAATGFSILRGVSKSFKESMKE